MLAACQRPAMGSFPPSDADNVPFGYDFDETQLLAQEHALSFGGIEIPSEVGPPGAPPAPATNNPLLGEHDAVNLNNFFSIFGGNHHLDEEGLYQFSEEWKDIPPDFIGSATSFGQRPSRAQPIQQLPSPFPTHTLLDHGLFPATSSPIHVAMAPGPSHVSPEVVAAETLLRSVHPQRPATQRHPLAVNHLGPSSLELQHTAALTSPAPEFPGDDSRTFASMVFGQHPRRVAPRRTDLPAFQFGSDSNFLPNRGFIPPSHRETSEALEHQHMRHLECLQVSQSRETTRPSSPSLGPQDMSSNQINLADTGDLPRKRRKSSHAKEEIDEESDPSHTSASAAQRRRRKSSTDNATLSPTAAGMVKKNRRKSTANGAKPPRENLTEEQKRANHIQSEQKRRKIIKDGFEDLISICPPLRGKSYSKSTMLTMAADWIEKLVATNKELRRQAEGVAPA